MVRPSFIWLLAVACAPAPGAPDPIAPQCVSDADCAALNACLEGSWCDAGACVAGTPRPCDAGEACTLDDGEPVCAPLCPLPTAPVLEVLAHDDTLTFQGPGVIETAAVAPERAWSDEDFVADPSVPGDIADGPTRVLARTSDAGCAPGEVFDHVYALEPAYPGPAGTPSSRAIGADDPRIVAWAAAVADVVYGDGVDEAWRVPERALGPAEGSSTEVVPLGHGGHLTAVFDPPIADGDGPDLAVFENSFSPTFLELAFVEVSSDGVAYARFDSAARTPQAGGSFALTEPSAVHGLAGVYRQGFGTPFDLALLRWHPLARTGQLDLSAVRYVRVVDVVGDGSTTDSFGRPIHHPFPSVASAGFDLDAIGALHVSPG